MHLSDLLGSRVVDAGGVTLGTVEDVRVVQDGPLLLPFGAAFRIDELTVSHHGIGRRLGYCRGEVRGPWLLRILFAALERHTTYIPWEAVTEWDGRTVRVAGAGSRSSRSSA